MGISAVIGTKNSAEHLDRVLDRLKDFDEILVCDFDSTDRTRDIAQQRGCNVTTIAENANIPEMMRAAFHKAKSEWLLFLSPYELVTPELVDYLHDFIKDPGRWRAIRIPRKNFVMHKWNNRKYPDFQLRFMHRDYVSWPNPTFDEPLVKGDIFRIPYDRYDLALVRIPVGLTTLIAEADRRSHVKGKTHSAPLMHAMWKPFACFLNEYFVKEMFRFGAAGFIRSINKSIEKYYYLTRQHEEKMVETYMKENDPDFKP